MNSLQTILDQIPTMLLVVFRLGGLAIYGPVFGSAVIPGRVKVFLVFLIGLGVFPVVAAGGNGWGQPLQLSLFALAPLLLVELLIGIVIGFLASLPLMAVQTGGLIMGQQMGLGFAQLYNPAIDDEADVVGQMLFYMALAGFLLVGGHEAMVLAVLNSFHHIGPGGLTPDVSLIALIAGMLSAALELALRVAAPLLALILLESVAMGFISKTVPQLNILSFGFPLRILLGFLTVATGLVIIDEVVMDALDATLATIFRFVEVAS